MQIAFRTLLACAVLAATLVVAPHEAHALTELSVAVVKTDTAENTRHYITGTYLNGGGFYDTRVDLLVALLKTEFTSVTIIGDAQLASLSEIEKYDVLVFPQTLAMTAAQRTALLQYVARGGGAVGMFGMSRWTPDSSNVYGYKPFIGMSDAPGVYLWPPSSNELKVWEWGEVSELYQVRFFNDPYMYADWQAAGKATSSHWILSQTAKETGRTSLTLTVGRTAFNESMLSLPGATGATPIFTYGTRANSYTADDSMNGTVAGMANEYYFGRFVYYGFQLYDVATAASYPVSSADRTAAQRLIMNSVKWAADTDSYRANNKAVSITGTAWHSSGILYVKPTVTNAGGVSLRGPFTITVYKPGGAVFGSYQAYAPHQTPLPPGSSYTHGSFQVRVGTAPVAGTWRVRVSYKYWDYLRGGTVEAHRDMYCTSSGSRMSLLALGAMVRPSGALPGIGTQIAGSDRYQTGIRLSEQGWPDGAGRSGAVILATGRNYPDALTASALAGKLDAPVLLVDPTAVRADVANELKRLFAGRTAATLYAVGGADVVPDAIVSGYSDILKAAGVAVGFERLDGATRFETALSVAREVGTPEQGEFANTAIIVSGLNYPDALSISPLAAAEGVPILPVSGTSVHPAVQTALAELEVEHCVIMGGTDVVSTQIESWLEANGYRVSGVADGAMSVDTRLGGATRYDTGVLALDFSVKMGAFDDTSVFVATGANWPDALALAPLAGGTRHPLLLVHGEDLGWSVTSARYLIARESRVPALTFVGGDGAVTPYVRGQSRIALGQ
ncbi:MAG: cell wall-binding repeat-containing protein [Coriobacteriia bacterium]|nr:cell wall-binding repeat-containing protein [Coriobacteriia bacterium]